MKQWLSGTATCSSGTFLTSTYGYDIAGNLLWMLDLRTVKRGWGYADSGVYPPGFSGTSYAFPTSITSYTGLNGGGTALTANLTWDYNISKPLTTVNVNGYTTYYSYPAYDGLDRLSNIARPDGGSTSITYVNTPGSLTTTSSVAQTSGPAITTQVAYL